MSSNTSAAGVVAAIYRYPVKSMLGEELNAARVEAGGVAGDRVHALIDDETGRVVSVKRPKRWSRIFELRAFTDGAVRVRFPDGIARSVDDASLTALLRAFFGRAVSVSSSPPPDAYFDEAWVRDLKDGAPPYFGRPSRFEDGDEIVAGGGLMGKQGNFFNHSPVHIVTTSTLRALAQAAPGSRFESQRFRPNVVIDIPGSEFVENGWRGRTLRIGSAVFGVTMAVPRCVMTTLAQGDLPHDPNVLRTITASNAIDALSTGTRYPCVGVYAQVLQAGEIHGGDVATLD